MKACQNLVEFRFILYGLRREGEYQRNITEKTLILDVCYLAARA
jgi:hypothetical protein